MAIEYKFDVFISYSRKDYVDEATKEKIPNNVISIIKKSFDDNGITYWIDEEGNLTGKKFAHIIAGKIRESMVFLFVCSNNSVASKWVDRELSVADTFDKHIIPFICDDSYKDDKVVMFTAALDRVEYFGKHNKDNEIAKLVKSIKKDKEEYEENRKREEEVLKRKQKEEEERKKREEQAKKKREAIKEIKRLATDYRMHSLQQETIVQQLHEKNLIIGKETKECPICKTTNPIETTFCEKCGFQFPQLYAVDGNESYPFDNRLLVTAKANYDAIAFAKKEKERLENKIAELTYSFEKISVECEQQLKTISQKEAEVVSYHNRCETLSVQLKNSKEQSEKLNRLEVQKKELENRIRKLQREKDEANQKIKELEKGREPYHDSSRWYEQSAERSSQQKEIGSPVFGALNGLFSIRPGKQVCFSKGNLQYQASSNNWRFADNQYDSIGKANESNSLLIKGWIDLFGWGTGDKPTEYAFNDNRYYSFVDWGDKIISNGASKYTWRTLTREEWDFVFNKRLTISGVRYAKAMIYNTKGVILFPDFWDNDIMNIVQPNTAEARFDANDIDYSLWIYLEQKGCVFLPTTGSRNGQTFNDNESGSYWSSTPVSQGRASRLFFNQETLNTCEIGYRCNGRAVRLVCDS